MVQFVSTQAAIYCRVSTGITDVGDQIIVLEKYTVN